MGAAWAWGIDVAAAGFDLSVTDLGTGRWVESATDRPRRPKDVDHAEQLASVLRLASLWLPIYAKSRPPAVIVVEQPAGAHPNPPLMGAWGVVSAVAFGVAGKAVLTNTPSQWRKAIGIKNKKVEAVEYGRSLGVPEDLGEDAAEAAAMAEAGRLWLGFEPTTRGQEQGPC